MSCGFGWRNAEQARDCGGTLERFLEDVHPVTIELSDAGTDDEREAGSPLDQSLLFQQHECLAHRHWIDTELLRHRARRRELLAHGEHAARNMEPDLVHDLAE